MKDFFTKVTESVFRTQSRKIASKPIGTDDYLDFEEFDYGEDHTNTAVNEAEVQLEKEPPRSLNSYPSQSVEWLEEELRDCLRLYLQMLEKTLSREPYNADELIKKFYQGHLSRHNVESINRRLQNFSYYFDLYDWPSVLDFEPHAPTNNILVECIEVILLEIAPTFSKFATSDGPDEIAPIDTPFDAAALEGDRNEVSETEPGVETVHGSGEHSTQKPEPLKPLAVYDAFDLDDIEDEEELDSFLPMDFSDEWDQESDPQDSEGDDDDENSVKWGSEADAFDDMSSARSGNLISDIFEDNQPFNIPDLLDIADIKAGGKIANLANMVDRGSATLDETAEFFRTVLTEYPRASSYNALIKLANKGVKLNIFRDIFQLKDYWADSFSTRCNRRFDKQRREWNVVTNSTFGRYQMTWVLGAQLLNEFEYDELCDAMQGHWFEEWLDMSVLSLGADNEMRQIFYSFTILLRYKCAPRRGREVYKNRRRELYIDDSEHDLPRHELSQIKKDLQRQYGVSIPNSIFPGNTHLNG